LELLALTIAPPRKFLVTAWLLELGWHNEPGKVVVAASATVPSKLKLISDNPNNVASVEMCFCVFIAISPCDMLFVHLQARRRAGSLHQGLVVVEA
jgi:hypothetical protein